MSLPLAADSDVISADSDMDTVTYIQVGKEREPGQGHCDPPRMMPPPLAAAIGAKACLLITTRGLAPPGDSEPRPAAGVASSVLVCRDSEAAAVTGGPSVLA